MTRSSVRETPFVIPNPMNDASDEHPEDHTSKGISWGDPEAAEILWQQYFDRLVRLAEHRLPRFAQREFDAEDVALSVLDSICRGAAAGRTPPLSDPDNLWPVLVVITSRKAMRRIRRQTAQKRGGGRVRGESVFGSVAGLDDVLGEEPTPDFVCDLAEHTQRLMAALPTDEVRHVAQLKLDGYSTDEIAERVGCARRTIARRLALIREVWGEELNHLPSSPDDTDEAAP